MMKTESISAQNRESLRQLRRRLVREQRAVSIRKFFRNKLSVVGMVLVLLMLICAVFAPLITGLLGVTRTPRRCRSAFRRRLPRTSSARTIWGAISSPVSFTARRFP